jgi:hypothetical protein
MQRPSFRLVLPALLAVLSAGCGGDSAPLAPEENYQGTYAMEKYSGLPLPRQISSDFVYRWFVVADTLRLLPDGTGTKVFVTELRPTNPAHSVITSRSTSAVTYQVRDGFLELTYPCQTPPCGFSYGHMEGEMLVLGQTFTHVYRRISR